MKRVLLTGMSGTGKSAVIEELARRGYKAIDLDTEAYSGWVAVTDDSSVPGTPVEPERDWVWREERIHELLAAEDADLLFVSGTAANMGQFLPRFDEVILLSAPAEVIAERLRTRPRNEYGKSADELARVLGLIEVVEPLLRKASDHEIDTSVALGEVVETVLRLTR